MRSAAAPVVVVSPHLDDGVLSCGQLLDAHPGGVVVTVFAGDPPADVPLTAWDADAGFDATKEVVPARRDEDAAACAALAATPCWLPFVEAQYAEAPPTPDVAYELASVLDAFGAPLVAIPLGLFHSEHRLVNEASLLAAAALGADVTVCVYADALYRALDTLLDDRLAELEHRGVRLRRFQPPLSSSIDRKRRAVACYRSQLQALRTPGRIDPEEALGEECYWELSRGIHD